MKIIENDEYLSLIIRMMRCLNRYAAVQNLSPEKEGRLSMLDAQVMHAVQRNEERQLNMVTLSKIVGITKGTFTKSINRLSKQDLVNKKHKNQNKKDVIVSLTDKGKAYCKRSLSSNEIFLKEMINILEEDPLRIKYFNEQIEMIERFLETMSQQDQ